MKRKYRNRLVRCGLALIVLFLSATIAINILPRPNLVTFFNVGEGDAALIQGSKGQVILIDGGPNQKIINLLAQKLPWGQKTIDLVILSHPHSDHLIGLVEVLKKYNVKNVMMPEVSCSSSIYQEFIKLIEKKKIRQIIPEENSSTSLVDELVLKIIFAGWLDKAKVDVNFASLVINIKLASKDFLFMGDAPQEVENILIASEAQIKADVIKIAHQGSAFSSSLNFLKQVKPELAIISVGKDNNYGHPSSQVLENIKINQIKLLRTDQQGDINIAIDKNSLKIIENNMLWWWQLSQWVNFAKRLFI